MWNGHEPRTALTSMESYCRASRVGKQLVERFAVQLLRRRGRAGFGSRTLSSTRAIHQITNAAA